MTNEEAKRKIESQKLQFLEEYIDYSGISEAYDMAIQALEKQIPKKPKYKTKINTVQGFRCEDIYVLCPSCDNRLYSIIDGEAVAGKKTNYCEKCGQRIRW